MLFRSVSQSRYKPLRGLEIGVDGLDEKTTDQDLIIKELREPGPERIWYVGDAFRLGMSIEEVFGHSKIDPWFLYQIKNIIDIEKDLIGNSLNDLSKENLFQLKQKGFSDRRLATLLKVKQEDIRNYRHKHNVRPVYKRVDTCAAEFSTNTAYMYSTYEEECEANPTTNKKIIVLGGGPNRIGQGIEFDYCCVHAALALREDGFENSGEGTRQIDTVTSEEGVP